jgi:hypothetical protein
MMPAMPADPRPSPLTPPLTPEELEAAVLADAKRIHDEMLMLFGEEKTRQLWKDLDKWPRGKKRPTNPQRDRTLLRLHDSLLAAGSDPKTLPRQVAQRSGKPGDVESAEKHVRRLLKKRAADRSSNPLTRCFGDK